MRPAVGVLVEVAGLILVLGAASLAPAGLPFALGVVIAQLAATYLVHCPGHYFVGSLVGIGFTDFRKGRSGLTKILPPKLSRFARLVPIMTLVTDKSSLAAASSGRRAAMYAAGTLASVISALVIAIVATASEPLLYSVAAWAVAVGYLAFDWVFSPRGGDLMRAKRAMRPP